MLIFFPPADAGKFETAGWGELQTAPADQPFQISKWEETDGPLAKTEEGLALPLAELVVQKRQAIIGEKTALATFGDGSAFLTRRAAGQGQILLRVVAERRVVGPQRRCGAGADAATLAPGRRAAVRAG